MDSRFSIEAITEALAKLGNGARKALRLGQFGSLVTQQAEPQRAELTRAGRRFYLGNSAAITGIANATALVTTAAQWALYNNSAKYTMFMEAISMYLTSGTPGAGGVLLGAMFKLPVVAAGETMYTGASITNANPDSGRRSKAVLKASITISEPAAPNWFVIANNDDSNVGAFPGSGTLENRNLQGSIMIPPGFGLGLAIIGLAGTTPLWAPSAEWVELETDNE